MYNIASYRAQRSCTTRGQADWYVHTHVHICKKWTLQIRSAIVLAVSMQARTNSRRCRAEVTN